MKSEPGIVDQQPETGQTKKIHQLVLRKTPRFLIDCIRIFTIILIIEEVSVSIISKYER